MKTRRAARFIAWFPVILLALLAGLSFWLEQIVKPGAPPRDARTRHDPDLILKSFDAVKLGATGAPSYTLAASELLRYPDDQTARLDNPRFVQISDTGVRTTITSKYGTVSGNGDNVYFVDDVKAVRGAYQDRSELTLETSYLQVTPELELARTDQAVTIRDANAMVSGVGLELRNEERIATVLSRVKGRYAPPKKPGPPPR
jgi:lipopolysaccharide export system protein LptC